MIPKTLEKPWTWLDWYSVATWMCFTACYQLNKYTESSAKTTWISV